MGSFAFFKRGLFGLFFSDVLIKILSYSKSLLYEVFKVQSHSQANALEVASQLHQVFTWLMEMERFELLTPCLQGRCSPN